MRDPYHELETLQKQDLLRKIRHIESGVSSQILIDGNCYHNFSSNDYLGLAQHPRLIDAAQRCTKEWGTGAGSSRLICGSQSPSQKLEKFIAQAKKSQSSLVFSNGYCTSVGTLTALLQKGDTIILDKLAHASLIDGARLSGATIRVFPHNDLKKLERILQSVTNKSTGQQRTIVVTEAVFSMDGDTAPLKAIIDLKNRYGAWLLVDEAHALGIYGNTGMGLAEDLGCADQIELQMGTLGKAAGAAGGYIAASNHIIALLVNRARSFIYSTAAPPAQYASAQAALELIRSEEGVKLRRKLWQNLGSFAELTGTSLPQSPIIAWHVGESAEAIKLMNKLRNQHQLIAPAIRFPTVPRNTARLRITITASHSAEQIQTLCHALQTLQ